MALAGVDIGTSGCKCTVMENGKELAVSYREYASSRKTGEHEIDAAVILAGVRTVIDEAFAAAGKSVDAVCVTSFGESCVLLDEHDEVIRPIMLYTDPRGTAEASELADRFGARHLFELTGHSASAMYFLPKLLWIKNNAPDDFKRIAKILPVNAYVIYALTNGTGYAVDYSLAARMMMLDVKKLDWADELLDYAQITRAQLPVPVEMGTAVGFLADHPETRAVMGCHDQVAAVIGAGAFKAGSAALGCGTVECITPVFDFVPTSDAFFNSGFAAVPARDGLYVTYAFILTGGALLQWYRNTLASDYMARAEAEGVSAYELLNRELPADPTGLLILPHFAGAATPYMDTASVGAIVGATLATTRPELYRAVMEGVAYELRCNLDKLKAAGVTVSSVIATGGGSRSEDWLSIRADVLDTPISTIDVREAGTVGSIVLAGLATGEYASASDASITVKDTFTPGKNRDAYARLYKKYQRMYTAVKQIYSEE